MKISRGAPLLPLKLVIDHSLRTIDRSRFSLAFLSFLKKLFIAEILCDNPFDFSKNHSTSLAYIDLLYMTKSTLLVIPIYMGLMNMRVVFFLIVLRPFFDTVDHNILLGKLEHYGVRGVALDLAGSYLSNGLQIVQFNSQCSSPQTICCGVPQGST